MSKFEKRIKGQGKLLDLIFVQSIWRSKYPKELSINEEALAQIVEEAKKEFPKSELWQSFVRDMKEHDAWYDLLDSHQVGELLDWMLEFMAKFEEYFGNE